MQTVLLRSALSSTKFWAALAFSATVALHLPLLRSGFDFHHNGLMLAAAIAVAEGKAIHSDFSFFYGPATPWSQGLLFLTNEKSAVSLSIWAIALTAGIAAILVAFNKVLPPNMGISLGGGIYVAALWVALSPSFVLGTIQAWSSLLGAFLVVLGAFAGLKAMKTESEGGISTSSFWWLLTGICVGLLPFARLNVGAALWVGICLWIWFHPRQPKLTFHTILPGQGYFFLGWLVTVTTITLQLWASGSLQGYFIQSVLGPASWAGEQANVASFLAEVFDNWLEYLPRAIPLLLIALGIERLRSIRSVPGLLLVTSRIASSLIIFFATFYAAGLQQILDEDSRLWGLRSFSDLLLFSSEQGLENRIADLTLFLLPVSILFGVIGIFSAFVAWRRSRVSHENVSRMMFLGIFALALFVQFWPLGDIYHLWWGSPLVILFLAITARRFQHGQGMWIWISPLMLLIAMQIVSMGIQLERRDHFGPENTVFSEISLDRRSSDYLENLNSLFEKHKVEGEKILFFVNNGFETVMNGSFDGASDALVAWSPGFEYFEDLASWDGKTMVDFISLRASGMKSFPEFAETYHLETIECSYHAEPYYNPQWSESEPYICIFEPLNQVHPPGLEPGTH